MIIKRYCLLNSYVFQSDNSREKVFINFFLEQIERFEESDGLPITRMIIPVSNRKKILTQKIGSTVY